jgi:uncharacterized protein with NRDE domain
MSWRSIPGFLKGLNFSALSGPKIKKFSGADRAVKRYHNKHKRGSGNFGFNIVWGTWGEPNYINIDLNGDYDPSGEIYNLSVHEYGNRNSREYDEKIKTVYRALKELVEVKQ